MKRPTFLMAATVLGSPYARDLAQFYQQLLGWRTVSDHGDWVMLRSDDDSAGLSFQSEPDHVPPTWPPTPDEQQMMMHLDIGVDDLEKGVAWAVECGAELAPHQPQTDVRVMLDPAGHPFCLFPV